MATLAENKQYYQNFDWRHTGEQWANRWRGTDVQWYGTILPRVHLFLPAASILEIGCGQGRLSRLLVGYCDRLTLVDMIGECVDGCRRIFEDNLRVRCLLGDGRALAAVEDASVDFVFSLFSLVHADMETMRGYLFEIDRVLTGDGAVFIHHSNGGACLTGDPPQDALLHDYRDTGVSADAIEACAAEAGLTCRGQELFGWDMEQLLTDCFSVVVKPGSRWAKPNSVICNWTFPSEAQRLGQLSEIYGAYGYAK